MVRFKVNRTTKELLIAHSRQIQATIAVLANGRCGKECTAPQGLVHDSGVIVNGKEILIKYNYIADRTTEQHPIRVTTKEEWATVEALHNTIQIAKDDPNKLYKAPTKLYNDRPLRFN